MDKMTNTGTSHRPLTSFDVQEVFTNLQIYSWVFCSLWSYRPKRLQSSFQITGCRGDHPREGQLESMGKLSIIQLHERLERLRRPGFGCLLSFGMRNIL